MNTCERLEICGFFNKYQHSTVIDCRGFINAYCKGNKKNECARLEYIRKYNEIPSNDMLPSGKMLESSNISEPYCKDGQQFF